MRDESQPSQDHHVRVQNPRVRDEPNGQDRAPRELRRSKRVIDASFSQRDEGRIVGIIVRCPSAAAKESVAAGLQDPGDLRGVPRPVLVSNMVKTTSIGNEIHAAIGEWEVQRIPLPPLHLYVSDPGARFRQAEGLLAPIQTAGSVSAFREEYCIPSRTAANIQRSAARGYETRANQTHELGARMCVIPSTKMLRLPVLGVPPGNVL
jgi:hypothetical protein